MEEGVVMRGELWLMNGEQWVGMEKSADTGGGGVSPLAFKLLEPTTESPFVCCGKTLGTSSLQRVGAS
eukprot:1539053-Lingulodinium_polyedra.AAC.1